MDKAIIIGYGITGKASGFALGIRHNVDLGDPDPTLRNFNTIILCLPTPTINGEQDLSAIEEWLEKISKTAKHAIVIIRSTVLPGTCRDLAKKYDLKIAHVPEFLTEATAIADAKKPELLVIGANDILVAEQVKELFKTIQPKYKINCNTTTAEMIKYAMNSFFMLKVVMANQLWDICGQNDANYDQVAMALEHHKWGSKNGWNVWHRGQRGAGGACLPKDVEAFIGNFKAPLLEQMYKINNELVVKTK